MHHTFSIVFFFLSMVILTWVIFHKRSEEDKSTSDDIYRNIFDEPISSKNHTEALDELVRLSEDFGLYDFTQSQTFAIEVDDVGNAIKYYVEGQLVTKEGYQWAQWTTGLYHPPAPKKDISND